MQINPFSITLKESFMISPKVKHFIFESDLQPAFNYAAGQFITVHFDYQGKALKRSYSIANEPRGDNLIEFAAGYVEQGPGTQYLFNLQPGDAIQVTGPFGRLILKDDIPKRYIFVATSTGITPYRAMLHELRQRLIQQPTLQIVILQGVQHQAEILYAEEFLTLVEQFPQVTFRSYLSRETNIDLNAHIHQGYVQHAFPDLNLNPQEDLVYLCGNPSMIDDAFNLLKDLGFAMQQVIREKYLSR